MNIVFEMSKAVKKTKLSKLDKTLGILSVGSIAAGIFMGYNRITGNVISAVEDSSMVSYGGIALFVIGMIGLLLVVKGK